MSSGQSPEDSLSRFNGMSMVPALVIRTVSIAVFPAALIAFTAIGIPEYGLWQMTGLHYRFWVDLSEKAGLLALFCMICCGILCLVRRNWSKQVKLRWCVCLNVTTMFVVFFTPVKNIAT